MGDRVQGESKADSIDNADKQDDHKPVSFNDVDMKAFQPMARGLDSLPPGFNHIETSTFDKLANKDGFVTRDSLKKAASDPSLDDIQRDDVQHMLKNFKVLSKEFDDKDGGKKGISREDVAKYNFPNDINHIESSTIDKLGLAADGTITKDSLAAGLKRKDLSDVERDDMEYLQRQYSNIKELSPAGGKKELGISIADIAASNARVDQFAARYSGADNYQLSTRHTQERAIDRLFEEQ